MPIESNRFSPADDAAASGARPDEIEANRHDGGGRAAFGRLERQSEELAELVGYYLSARIDAIKLSLRSYAILAALALLGLAVVGTFLAASVVVGMLGVAELMGQALGDRAWAGNLITGIGFLILCGAGLFAGLTTLKRSFRERTIRRYVRRRQRQKARFGRDVAERAAAARTRPRD